MTFFVVISTLKTWDVFYKTISVQYECLKDVLKLYQVYIESKNTSVFSEHNYVCYKYLMNVYECQKDVSETLNTYIDKEE